MHMKTHPTQNFVLFKTNTNKCQIKPNKKKINLVLGLLEDKP